MAYSRERRVFTNFHEEVNFFDKTLKDAIFELTGYLHEYGPKATITISDDCDGGMMLNITTHTTESDEDYNLRMAKLTIEDDVEYANYLRLKEKFKAK